MGDETELPELPFSKWDTISGQDDAGEANMLTLCAIGVTGSGKSSTCNTLFKLSGEDQFQSGGALDSITQQSFIKERQWRGTDLKIRCVDTPGFGDSREGSNTKHVENLVDTLKNYVKFVHAFLIVFNGASARLDDQLSEMLQMFQDIFGLEFMSNVMIVYTHWDYGQCGEDDRDDGDTKEDRSQKINLKLQKLLGHSHFCPCAFLDNNIHKKKESVIQRKYGDEFKIAMQEFEGELDGILRFMHRKPFCCREIAHVLAQKEEMKKRIREVNTFLQQMTAAAAPLLTLDRNLIEADIIKEGEVRCRGRSMWVVLRRQRMRCQKSEHDTDVPGHLPSIFHEDCDLDLTGCICSEGRRSITGWWRFHLFIPSERNYECIELNCETFFERSQWILLINEATQISDSCHRIQKFKSAMDKAGNSTQYIRAMDMVENQNLVIPVLWVQSQTRLKQYPIDRKQVRKDLQRESVEIDGKLYVNPAQDDPELEELEAGIAQRILTCNKPSDTQTEAKAYILAGDVLMSCCRTQATGDILDAVNHLFGQFDVDPDHPELRYPRIVNILPPEDGQGKISLRVLKATGPDNTLQTIGSCTGVPQFEGDASAELIDYKCMENVKSDGNLDLSVVSADRRSWVADWESMNCMRCGLQFNFIQRRHHCRPCGALVCNGCSKVSLPNCSRRLGGLESFPSTSSISLEGGSPATSFEGKVRVCFLCYHKAVIANLTAKKMQSSSSCSLTALGETILSDSEEEKCEGDKGEGDKVADEPTPNGTSPYPVNSPPNQDSNALPRPESFGSDGVELAERKEADTEAEKVAQIEWGTDWDAKFQAAAQRLCNQHDGSNAILVFNRNGDKLSVIQTPGLAFELDVVPDREQFPLRLQAPISSASRTTAKVTTEPPKEKEDDQWPVISVEMGSTYRVCLMDRAIKTSDLDVHELSPRISAIHGSVAAGSYEVEGASEKGEGSGAKFRVIVGERIESIQATRGGKGYQAHDIITLPDVRLTIQLEDEDLVWSMNMDREVLFYLDCRHTRIVRWSGLKDEGRVVVSIRRPILDDGFPAH